MKNGIIVDGVEYELVNDQRFVTDPVGCDEICEASHLCERLGENDLCRVFGATRTQCLKRKSNNG